MTVEREPLFDRLDDATYLPSVYTRGPWDPGLLHGGPVAALFATVFEAEADPEFQPARLTVDLIRPVPFQPLAVRTSVVRAGRRLQVLEATVKTPKNDVARATFVALRPVPLDVDEAAVNPRLDPPPDGPDDEVDRSWRPPIDAESFVGGGMDFRFMAQQGLGAGVAWLRLRRPVVDGVPPSPLARAAAAADVGNAVSARRGPGAPRLSFVNADLSLSLSRLPEGEWVRLASGGRWETNGIGSVSSSMSDERGAVGTVTNALVLEAVDGPFHWETLTTP